VAPSSAKIVSPAPRPAARNESARFRFGLKSLFALLAAVGVLSGMIRAVATSDPAAIVGLGAFCYGGIIAIPCYAFVGSLMVLTTKTTRGQRAGEIFAAIIGAGAWITFLFAALNQSPQMFVVYSLVAIAALVWLVRRNWKPEDGPSPENSLQRLIAVKKACVHQQPADSEVAKP
jgi:hypothetical protein